VAAPVEYGEVQGSGFEERAIEVTEGNGGGPENMRTAKHAKLPAKATGCGRSPWEISGVFSKASGFGRCRATGVKELNGGCWRRGEEGTCFCAAKWTYFAAAGLTAGREIVGERKIACCKMAFHFAAADTFCSRSLTQDWRLDVPARSVSGALQPD
jgi:hypothetical protein